MQSFKTQMIEINRVAPIVRFLLHRFLKHRLQKHQFFSPKHQLAKRSTGNNINYILPFTLLVKKSILIELDLFNSIDFF
jgi:hypothetical protein